MAAESEKLDIEVEKPILPQQIGVRFSIKLYIFEI